jgi:hypothetical protein
MDLMLKNVKPVWFYWQVVKIRTGTAMTGFREGCSACP